MGKRGPADNWDGGAQALAAISMMLA